MTHWFFDPAFTETSSFVGQEELRHFASLRIRSGEEIVLTDGRGSAFRCRVVDPSKGAVEVLDHSLISKPKLTIHLIQALAKGDRDELALQTSVELGVSSVTPFQAENSIVDWTKKTDKGIARWQQIANSAMKQSQQAWQTEIAPLATTAATPRGHGILLVPSAEKSITAVPRDAHEFTIAVGPEGGFSEAEVAKFLAAGFQSYRLGPSVLRTSSAGPAAIAALNAVLGGWLIA